MGDALRLRPQTVVVLEGLDRTGKTTQFDVLRGSLLSPDVKAMRTPAGNRLFSQRMYELFHDPAAAPQDALARQLAHLACHLENMDEMSRAASGSGLLLDRWWWSTVAYGSGGTSSRGRIRLLTDLATTVWAPVRASVVFLFDRPHRADPSNRPEVQRAYEELAAENAGLVERVPALSINRTTAFIAETLTRRHLLELE